MKKFLLIGVTLLQIVPVLGFFLMVPSKIVRAEELKPANSGFKIVVECTGETIQMEGGRKTNQCTFKDFIRQMQKIISWFIFIAIPFTALIAAIAGFRYMTGKEDQMTKAKDMLKTVVKGFVIMLLAWLVINTVINAFVDKKVIKETFLEDNRNK